MKTIVIGKILRPIGLKGIVSAQIFSKGKVGKLQGLHVYLDQNIAVIQSAISVRRGYARIKFRGIETIEQAESLRNLHITALRKDIIAIYKGIYQPWDIIGISAYNQQGEELGIVDQIIETGSNDVYLILHPEGKHILAPAISRSVISIDVEAKKMVLVQENCTI